MTDTNPGTGTAADSPSTMRRVVVRERAIDVVDAPVPAPAAGEAQVRSLVVGVCGSDTHAAHGRHPFIALPYHPGHEVVGEVTAVGPEVTAVSAGDRVVVEPDLPCWQCKMCLSHRENLCENLRFFGCGYEQGGMAELFTIPAGRLHRVPDDLGEAAAALIEPLSTPVHAVRLAGDVRGKAVAVLGAGAIGLLVLHVLLAAGARRVVVTDVRADKRERAVALGAHAGVDAAAADAVDQVRRELGESADVVFDCVAVQSTLRAAIGMASKGGTVVVVGVPSSDVSVPLAIVQDHQIRIQGSATYLAEDYAAAMALLRSGSVDADALVTAVDSLDRAAEAFDLSASGEHVKVVVRLAPARE
jgi:2-desacetyl-2-hydroxyethyl bacteriochlorophyllide A dehydrogenase